MTEHMNVSRKSVFAIILSLLLVFSLVLPILPTGLVQVVSAEEDVEFDASEKRIVAYYTNWANYGRAHQVLDLDVSEITHILYAFGDFCWEGRDNRGSPPRTDQCYDYKERVDMPDGMVVSSDVWADFQNENLVRLTEEEKAEWDVDYYGNLGAFHKLKKENPHLKVMFTLGGWTLSKHFSDVLNDDAARKTLVETAVDFIRTYDMDGIDVDWEYPVGGGQEGNSNRPEDKQNHTIFLQELRDELDKYGPEDGKEYELSIASSANPDYLENNEMEKLGEILDFVNIMTYDFYVAHEGVNGHNAALYADPNSESAGAALYNVETAILGHLDAGIPAEKLVMGMAMYGRSWADCSGEYTECSGPGEGTWENGVVDYDDVLLKLSHPDSKYELFWNDQAKVPYLIHENGEFVSFDDVRSIELKAEFAKEHNLGGAMFWELSQDRQYDLVRTVTNVFNDIDTNVELEVNSNDEVLIHKGKKVTGIDSGKNAFELELPITLPYKTYLEVNKVKASKKNLPDGYIVNGNVYDFKVTYPEARGGFADTISLSLPVTSDAKNPVVHVYDEEAEVWEKVDGDGVVEDGQITVKVKHFAQYAVMSEGTAFAGTVAMITIISAAVLVLIGVIWFNLYRRKINADDALL